LPADVEYDQCGTLWLAADEEEMAEVHRKQRYYSERGVRVQVLDAAGVNKAEPNLRPGMAGGLRVLDDAVLYPPCAARFLLDQAVQQGAEVRTGVTVTQLLPAGGGALLRGSPNSAPRPAHAARPSLPEPT